MKKRNSISSRHITFELTYNCNHDCYYCYNKYKKNDLNKKYYDLNKLKNLLIEMALYKSDENKFLTIIFTGGEVTLQLDKLTEILYFAHELKKQRKKPINLDINTNLTIMPDEFINVLKETDCHTFISLISHEEDIYNQVTKSKNYNNFINNFKKIINNDINHQGNIVVNYYNVDKLDDMVDFYFNLGCKRICVCFGYGDLEGFKNRAFYEKYIFKCLKEKEKYGNSFGFSLTLSPCQIQKIFPNKSVFLNCPYSNGMISFNPDNKCCGCSRDPFNVSSAFLNYEDAINKIEKSLYIIPQYSKECEDCKMNFLCYGVCGHENQSFRIPERKIMIQNMINIIKNKEDFNNFCLFYKNNNHYPEIVDFINKNIYNIWDLLPIYEKAMEYDEKNKSKF